MVLLGRAMACSHRLTIQTTVWQQLRCKFWLEVDTFYLQFVQYRQNNILAILYKLYDYLTLEVAVFAACYRPITPSTANERASLLYQREPIYTLHHVHLVCPVLEMGKP